MSLNLILLIGNAGRDAELRFTATGRQVANFSLAVNRNYQVNGEWQEETEWFNVATWGQQAENVANSVRRGSRVFVEGRLSSREWTNQAGVTRTSLEVNAFRVINLTRREDGEEGGYGSYPPSPGGEQSPGGGTGQQPSPSPAPDYSPAGDFEPPADGDDLEDLPW